MNRNTTPSPRRARSARKAVVLAVVGWIACLVAAPWRAGAQGPQPFAPPLSSADLDRWLERTAADAPTRTAIAAMFERALAESQALRDGEMAAYEQECALKPSRTLTKDELEQRSRRARALVARQAAVEDALFNSLRDLVPESAHAAVEAERRAAARRRAVATLDPMARSAVSAELLGIAERALTPADLQQREVAAALRDYDLQLTSDLEKLAGLALTSDLAAREAMEKLEAAPPAPEEPNDPEAAARRRMRLGLTARREAMAPVRERIDEIARARRAALDDLSARLPEDRALALRETFVDAAYPMIGAKRFGPKSLVERAAAAAESPAAGAAPIPPETIESAKRLLAEWRRADAAIARRMIDVVDERRRSQASGPMVFFDGDEGVPVLGEPGPMLDLRTERDRLDEQARRQIAALHPAIAAIAEELQPGPQVSFGPGAHLEAPAGVEFSTTSVMMVAVGDADGGADAVMIDMPGFAMGGGPALRPIDGREFDRMAARLQLDPAKASSLRQSWEQYRATADAAMRELLATPESVTMQGPGDAVFVMAAAAPDPEKLSQAAARLAAEDDAFMAEAAKRVGAGPAIDRERAIRARERQRQQLAVRAGPGPRPWGRFERVDLPAIVSEARLAAEERAAAEPVASAHGERLGALLVELIGATVALRQLEQAAIERIDHGDGNVEERVNLGGEEWQKAHGAVRAAQRAVTAEVRAALDQVAGLVAAPSARSIRRAAHAEAMPEVMRDPRSAEGRLEQALALESLSDERRLAIVDLLSTHQASVDRLVDRFIADALERERRLGVPDEPGPMEIRAMRSADALQRRLRFDRSEINDATMRRLRQLLTAEENRTIEDLPERSGGGMSVIDLGL